MRQGGREPDAKEETEYSAHFRAPFGDFRGPSRSDFLLILAFGFSLRVALLWLFPVPYGEDAFGRLYFSDRIFLSHWLPLTQLIVYSISKLGGGILPIRLAFALLGSLAAFGFHLFLRRIVPRPAALLGGLLFSVNALYVQLSLMPYQDVLFLGLFYAALGSLGEGGRRQEAGGRGWKGKAVFSLLFGLSCLTRYESWFLIPVLVFWNGLQSRDAGWTALLRTLAAAGLLFGWGPLLWLGLSQIHYGGWAEFLHQTADGTFYAWHPHLDLIWMGEYALRMLYWVGRFGSPVLLLALPGMAALLRSRRPMPLPMALLLVFGLFVAVFFFVIIGKEQDTVYRFCMIPLSIGLVFAVLGLKESLHWKHLWAKRRLAATLLLGLLVLYAAIPIYRLNQDPAYRDPYLAARFLEALMHDDETALVVADRSRQLEDAAPLAYQRVAAQIRRPRERVISAGLIGEGEDLRGYLQRHRVRYLVLFEGFEPWLEADRYFAGMAQEGGLEKVMEGEAVGVYEVGGEEGMNR